jgi:hypothetical protein
MSNTHPILNILDHFWDQVAGSDEYRHTQWAMSTQITAKTFSKGKATGVGLWGSGEVNWSIDFGEKADRLDFDCQCQAMKVAGKSGQTAPCNHLIRALIQMEAKLSKKKFEEVHTDRISRVIPF